MEDRIVEINAQIEESRLDQLRTSLNNLGAQFTIQKQLMLEDQGLAEVETANAIPHSNNNEPSKKFKLCVLVMAKFKRVVYFQGSDWYKCQMVN